MCGIFGCFLRGPLTEADIALCREGTARLAHRGPDGQGEWMDRDRGVYLGHRRLAIIDLTAAAAQPMARDGHVVAYNGELYNFLDIRERLAGLGQAFSTRSDTEVLLNAWRQWGQDALAHFDGMFAFAVWDGQAAWLATDPFGEKPLYVAQTRRGTYMCSELGPLVELLGLTPRLEGEVALAYLALGHIPAPDTAFPEVQRLPSASVACVQDGVCGPVRRYWTPPIPECDRGRVQPVDEGALDRLRDSLVLSLQRRTIADVPLALFLSAGIDSSLTAALCVREAGSSPQALTVSFPAGRATDEAPRAAAIARHLGLAHEVIESGEDAQDVSPGALLRFFAQPNDNVTAFSVRQLSRLVCARCKVALTGLGGDEVTLGYGKHFGMYRFQRYYDMPATLRTALRGVAACLAPLSRKFATLGSVVLVEPHERYLAVKNSGLIDWLRALPGFDAWARKTFGAGGRWEFLQVMRHDLGRGLNDEHLPTCDLGSMRAGLELRTPFLCRAVVEEVAGWDARALVAFGQKSVLRRLLGRYIPQTLTNYPKSGFIFPADRFLAACDPPRADLLPFLPGELLAPAWQRRNETGGWLRLCVRLAVAQEFLQHDTLRGTK